MGKLINDKELTGHSEGFGYRKSDSHLGEWKLYHSSDVCAQAPG